MKYGMNEIVIFIELFNKFSRLEIDNHVESMKPNQLRKLNHDLELLRNELLNTVPRKDFSETTVPLLKAYENLNDLIWLKSQDVLDVLYGYEESESDE